MDKSEQQSSNSDQNTAKTQAVHIVRPANPEKLVIDDATKQKHDQSVQLHPGLNLCEGEYVISAVERHPIGLFAPFALGLSLIILSLAALFNYDYIANSIKANGNTANPVMVILLIAMFIALIILVTYVAYYIYTNNKFFLTNECVIQEIQVGLFNHKEQTVSLFNVEDVSFTQDNILEQLMDFGSIQICTEGEENDYLFTYVPHPRDCVATLNNAVEAFKNGRPITEV